MIIIVPEAIYLLLFYLDLINEINIYINHWKATQISWLSLSEEKYNLHK